MQTYYKRRRNPCNLLICFSKAYVISKRLQVGVIVSARHSRTHIRTRIQFPSSANSWTRIAKATTLTSTAPTSASRPFLLPCDWLESQVAVRLKYCYAAWYVLAGHKEIFINLPTKCIALEHGYVLA